MLESKPDLVSCAFSASPEMNVSSLAFLTSCASLKAGSSPSSSSFKSPLAPRLACRTLMLAAGSSSSPYSSSYRSGLYRRRPSAGIRTLLLLLNLLPPLLLLLPLLLPMLLPMLLPPRFFGLNSALCVLLSCEGPVSHSDCHPIDLVPLPLARGTFAGSVELLMVLIGEVLVLVVCRGLLGARMGNLIPAALAVLLACCPSRDTCCWCGVRGRTCDPEAWRRDADESSSLRSWA